MTSYNQMVSFGAVEPMACVDVELGSNANATVIATFCVNQQRWTTFTIPRFTLAKFSFPISLQLLRFATRTGKAGSIGADITTYANEISAWRAGIENLVAVKIISSKADNSLQTSYLAAYNANAANFLPASLKTVVGSNKLACYSFQADGNLDGSTGAGGYASIQFSEACSVVLDAFCLSLKIVPCNLLPTGGLPIDTVAASLSYVLQARRSAFILNGQLQYTPPVQPREFNDFAVTASSSTFSPFSSLETLIGHHNAISNVSTASKVSQLVNLKLQRSVEE